MFNKAFNDILLEDVENLALVRKEREGNNLEYKEKVNNSDSGKKEFLKDISGLANSNGGFFLIGIREADGVPSEVIGMEKEIGNQKIDEWIDNMLISNLSEKIQYEIKIFEIENEKVVVLMYVPESMKKPHMVTFRGKNTYFIRHNTAVTPAIQSEVKEMFAFSKKNRDEFETFLKKRNLFDEESENFGKNDNSEQLFNDDIDNHSYVLLSFIPRYMAENRVNVISQDFQKWLGQNSNKFEPAPHIRLFETHTKRVNLYGVNFPNVLDRAEGETGEKYWDYVEILNCGFLEWGTSLDILRNRGIIDDPPTNKHIFNLSVSIGMTWLLFNFAKEYFKEIQYYDEVIFQFSAVNIRGYRLGGFSKNWGEPFSFDMRRPLAPCSHNNFKLIEKFIVNELTDESIEQIILSLSEQVSRAFGETVTKCFDKEGNFNSEPLNYLR